MLSPNNLQQYFKGIANHRRIEILLLLNKKDGLCLEDISEKLKVNVKTISGHTKTLVASHLINKKYKGRFISHSLTNHGKKMIDIIKKFN